MTGFMLTSPGAKFPSCAGLHTIPQVDDCVAWHWLGRSKEQSLKNWVPGAPAGVIVGDGPAVLGSYCRFESPAGHINTLAPESDVMTLLVVARCPTFTNSTSSSFWLSTELEETSGVSLKAIQGGPQIKAIYDNSGTPASRVKNYTPADTPTRIAHVKEWAFRGGIIAPGLITYFDRTHGYTQDAVVNLTTRIRNADSGGLRIGAQPTVGPTILPAEIAWISAYKVALSQVVIDEIYGIVLGIEGRRKIIV